MNSKKWIKSFFIVTLLIPINIMINYFIDPSNIFNTNLFSKYGQLNERFLKIQYLDENYSKFNSYMFGSSRIGTTEPYILEKYIDDSRFYNFALSSANMYDYLLHLQYFIKNYKIENLYLQIDINIMSYYKAEGFHRKLHPNVLNESSYEFYKTHLLGFYPTGLKRKFIENFFYNEIKIYNINSGVWARPTKEIKIVNNYQQYVQNEPTFNENYKRYMKLSSNYEKTTSSLKRIVKLCHKNNINLIVFTTPHNKNMMDVFDVKSYLQFIVDIASVTNFYDFSGYNTITKNNSNYYEYSHYRPLIGTLIAAKIFDDELVNVPSDFGVYVTNENVSIHIESLKHELMNYDFKKELE